MSHKAFMRFILLFLAIIALARAEIIAAPFVTKEQYGDETHEVRYITVACDQDNPDMQLEIGGRVVNVHCHPPVLYYDVVRMMAVPQHVYIHHVRACRTAQTADVGITNSTTGEILTEATVVAKNMTSGEETNSPTPMGYDHPLGEIDQNELAAKAASAFGQLGGAGILLGGVGGFIIGAFSPLWQRNYYTKYYSTPEVFKFHNTNRWCPRGREAQEAYAADKKEYVYTGESVGWWVFKRPVQYEVTGTDIRAVCGLYDSFVDTSAHMCDNVRDHEGNLYGDIDFCTYSSGAITEESYVRRLATTGLIRGLDWLTGNFSDTQNAMKDVANTTLNLLQSFQTLRMQYQNDFSIYQDAIVQQRDALSENMTDALGVLNSRYSAAFQTNLDQVEQLRVDAARVSSQYSEVLANHSNVDAVGMRLLQHMASAAQNFIQGLRDMIVKTFARMDEQINNRDLLRDIVNGLYTQIEKMHQRDPEQIAFVGFAVPPHALSEKDMRFLVDSHIISYTADEAGGQRVYWRRINYYMDTRRALDSVSAWYDLINLFLDASETRCYRPVVLDDDGAVVAEDDRYANYTEACVLWAEVTEVSCLNPVRQSFTWNNSAQAMFDGLAVSPYCSEGTDAATRRVLRSSTEIHQWLSGESVCGATTENGYDFASYFVGRHAHIDVVADRPACGASVYELIHGAIGKEPPVTVEAWVYSSLQLDARAMSGRLVKLSERVYGVMPTGVDIDIEYGKRGDVRSTGTYPMCMTLTWASVSPRTTGVYTAYPSPGEFISASVDVDGVISSTEPVVVSEDLGRIPREFSFVGDPMEIGERGSIHDVPDGLLEISPVNREGKVTYLSWASTVYDTPTYENSRALGLQSHFSPKAAYADAGLFLVNASRRESGAYYCSSSMDSGPSVSEHCRLRTYTDVEAFSYHGQTYFAASLRNYKLITRLKIDFGDIVVMAGSGECTNIVRLVRDTRGFGSLVLTNPLTTAATPHRIRTWTTLEDPHGVCTSETQVTVPAVASKDVPLPACANLTVVVDVRKVNGTQVCWRAEGESFSVTLAAFQQPISIAEHTEIIASVARTALDSYDAVQLLLAFGNDTQAQQQVEQMRVDLVAISPAPAIIPMNNSDIMEALTIVFRGLDNATALVNAARAKSRLQEQQYKTRLHESRGIYARVSAEAFHRAEILDNITINHERVDQFRGRFNTQVYARYHRSLLELFGVDVGDFEDAGNLLAGVIVGCALTIYNLARATPHILESILDGAGDFLKSLLTNLLRILPIILIVLAIGVIGYVLVKYVLGAICKKLTTKSKSSFCGYRERDEKFEKIFRAMKEATQTHAQM